MSAHVCLCQVCPRCNSEESVQSDYVWRTGLRKLWFVRNYCHHCGTRWGSWHALERWLGFSVRRVVVYATGTLTAPEVEKLQGLRRQAPDSLSTRSTAGHITMAEINTWLTEIWPNSQEAASE